MGLLESGWDISNGVVVYPSSIDSYHAWKFIHEAITDGHIPVVRGIGYNLINPTKGSSVEQRRYAKRFPGCAEDRFTLVANFSKLLFLVEQNVKRVRVEEAQGIIHTESATFLASTKEVRVLSTCDRLYTALDEVSAEIAVSIGTGYVSADENYEKLRKANKATAKTRLFPMFSYHNIMDFVRVLPYSEDGVIRLKYNHGMTDDMLRDLFIRMFDLRMDQEWLGKYEDIVA